MQKTRKSKRQTKLERTFEQRLREIDFDDDREIHRLAWILFLCSPEVDSDRLAMI